jgi:phosphoribosyl-ATP pyrophosphohydrolase/phosphoribosyl-AMP cyclohydrolase
MRELADADVSFDQSGLIPAIVQDAHTRAVLMLGYMDAEALHATQSSGLVHFHSRSRDELWKKGETSGNTLTVVSITADCDGDALLVTAQPVGPTCHTGTLSCWDDEPTRREPGFADLERLWATIEDRRTSRPPDAYTTALLDDPDLAVRKLTEEATEVLMAARDHRRGDATDQRLAEEMADLIYHLLVVCAERNLSPSLFLTELRSRRTK